MNDNLRTAIIVTIQSAFPVLLIAGIVSLEPEEIGLIMVFIANALTLTFFFFKSGQEQGPGGEAELELVQVRIPDDREYIYTHPTPEGECASQVPEWWDGAPRTCYCQRMELIGENYIPP